MPGPGATPRLCQGDHMKKALRLAALAGVLGLSLISLKQAEAQATPCLFNICADGLPCSVNKDCGCLESGGYAGVCTHNHTCVCL